MSENSKTRLITSVVAAAFVILIISIGPVAIAIATFIVSIIGMHELYDAGNETFRSLRGVAYFFALLLYVGYFIGGELGLVLFIIQASFVVLVCIPLLGKVKLQDSAFTFLGIIYVLVPIYYINILVATYPVQYLYFAFLIPVSTDIFAYLVGKYFGFQKLIPEISPNKTVEGAIGGIIASVLISMIFSAIFVREIFAFAALLGLIGGILAQIGDLIASKIKRIFKIKDYGNLLPGHGGILDRLDSLIVIFPFIYFSYRIIGYISTNVPF